VKKTNGKKRKKQTFYLSRVRKNPQTEGTRKRPMALEGEKKSSKGRIEGTTGN